MQFNNNRNAVITYTVIFVLILLASIYVVHYTGFRLQNLISVSDGKSSDEDVIQTNSLEELLQEGGDQLLAYAEKLVEDENSVLMNGEGMMKVVNDKVGYGSGGGDNVSRTQVSYSEFGRNNNSRDDMTSDALNNIMRNYLNYVGLKKEEAEAAKNAHYARLQQIDENMLSSKEKQWKIQEEKRRKKRLISRRGVVSKDQDLQSETLDSNNDTEIIYKSLMKDSIATETNVTKLNTSTMLKKNIISNSNSVDEKSSFPESNDVDQKLQLHNTGPEALKNSELQCNAISIRTRSLDEPRILSLPSNVINAMIGQGNITDQGKRMMKREDAAKVDSEEQLKGTTLCVPKDSGPVKPVKPNGAGKTSESPIRKVDVDSDGDDIAAAKLINGFMQSVMDQAAKIGNLKSELGLGRKSDVEYQSFTNINKTVTNEFMSNVFGCVDKLVENTLARQVCGQLPPDMKRFLNWLLNSGVSKEQACSAQKSSGETDFANFVFSAAGSNRNETRFNNVNIINEQCSSMEKNRNI
ncbi:uncharacterized protein LOC111044253 [Nilaparvata lugens]|uniref:uncharacterized protein LOC111044253 n=1 Tax=Nilaparvata lugens TaxID=108931 RepID=UPI00193D99A1|nr:uncharacterized protein LOC111044253 [Nilaparvata lugens]